MPTVGGRDPPLAGPIPESGNTAGWVDVHLKVQSWQKLAGIRDGHFTDFSYVIWVCLKRPGKK